MFCEFVLHLKFRHVGREGVKVVEAAADGLLFLSQEQNSISRESRVKQRPLGIPVRLLCEDGVALSNAYADGAKILDPR